MSILLREWIRLMLCVCMLKLGVSQASPPSSQTLFERIRPSVVEVLTKNRTNQSVAAAASGFLTQRQDWIVTNYHAVTEAIFEPEDNELSVVTQQKLRLTAQVLAVDVRHDLAILQLKAPMSAPLLRLRETLPAKGEPGYSMGKPGRYQHSIVSGTFNGLVDEDSSPLIVFSGAINPGMSGGPTLNALGEVVGINDASSTENQLLGLAVPAQALGALLRANAGSVVPDNAKLRQDIARQFAAYGRFQAQQMAALQQAERTLGPFQVRAELAKDKECSFTSHDQHERRYLMFEQRCTTPFGLYIMPNLYAGQVGAASFWLRGNEMAPLALARLVERRLGDLRKLNDEEQPVGRWSCQEQRLRAGDDTPIQLHACRRPVDKLPGLFDFRFRYTPLIPGPDALVVAMALSGFDDATAKSVLRQSLASFRLHKEQP